MSQWWVRIRGRVMGPFSAREFQGLLKSGEVLPYHECSSDHVTWVPVSDVPELSPQDGGRRSRGGAVADPPPEDRDEDDDRPRRRRSREEAPPPPVRKGVPGYVVLIAALAGVLVVGGVATAVLLLVGGGRRDSAISLTGKTESEKTRLLESAVCFIVPGHVVTTAKGEELEGCLLPKVIDSKGIQFSGGTGSGFVITKDGYILTNRHVIRQFSEYRRSNILSEYEQTRGAKVKPQIWVFFGREEKHTATLEYESPDYDFALLKIDGPRASYFSLCETKPEDIPLLNGLKAVGYPGKDSETIDVTGAVNQTLRIEEGKRSDFLYQTVQRNFPEDQFNVSSRPGDLTKRSELKRMRNNEVDSHVLRHNAQIFGGNSGGPLVCKDGTVVGINTWNLDEPGISFALTLPQLRKAIDGHVPGVVWRRHPE